jgi:TonB family protein
MAIRKTLLILTTTILTAAFALGSVSALYSQSPGPLTYPELITALQTKVPNRAFRTKDELIRWVTSQIRSRRVDKPLTKDREEDLRQAGAPDTMIGAIRENSPPLPVVDEPVDLGELGGKAINLVRPQYTEEARKARTQGQVKLALELDEKGNVVSITRLTVLENGLTDQAIEAARRSTFQPAMRDGKPARGKGILSFNFAINLIDIPTVLAAANTLREQRECDRAVNEYNRILNIEAKHVQALFGRGMCRLMFSQFDVAASDLSAASSADPGNADLLYHLAITQDFQGDHASAAGNYQKALQIRPDLDSRTIFKCLFIDRGPMTPEQARSAAGRIISACNEAAKGTPQDLSTMIYFKRGIAYRLQSDLDRSITDFENVKRSNPRFTAANVQLQVSYNARGLEAFNKKEYKKAYEDVTLAINVDPSNPVPYVNRCAIHVFGFKQYTDAINDCSSAIRLSGRSVSAYNYRGYAYEMTNNRDGAIADYTKALELDLRNESARSSLSRLQPVKPTMKDN